MKSRFFEISSQVSSNCLFKENIGVNDCGTFKKINSKMKQKSLNETETRFSDLVSGDEKNSEKTLDIKKRVNQTILYSYLHCQIRIHFFVYNVTSLLSKQIYCCKEHDHQ